LKTTKSSLDIVKLVGLHQKAKPSSHVSCNNLLVPIKRFNDFEEDPEFFKELNENNVKASKNLKTEATEKARPRPHHHQSSNSVNNYKRLQNIFKEYHGDDEELIPVKPVEKCRCPTLIDAKMRYTSIVIIITIISILCFLIFAIIAYFNPMYDAFGAGILFSRGAALSIIVLTILAMFLVTYDLTTFCRNKLKKR